MIYILTSPSFSPLDSFQLEIMHVASQYGLVNLPVTETALQFG
jgi:hypothetical protein